MRPTVPKRLDSTAIIGCQLIQISLLSEYNVSLTFCACTQADLEEPNVIQLCTPRKGASVVVYQSDQKALEENTVIY